MKTLATLIFFGLSLSSFAQKKMALIVAIGNYMPESNIPPIASLEDIKYIRSVLNFNGFADKNIDTLKDEQATKAGILNELDRLAKNAKKGDIVVIHFACHGQQIRDQKTVETGMDEEDGYDEALLPYDVKGAQYFAGVYEGEKHLRDDDLGPKLIAIRNSLGSTGNLLVLIDACHSGTATRATEFTQSRGNPVPFIDPENPFSTTVTLPAEDHFFDDLSDSASNMVVISGSGPQQQNFQTSIIVNGLREQVGSLSYAFYKAMNELPAGSDYELLYQKIKTFIQAVHPSQMPLIEGNASQVIFSGNFNAKKETIYLRPVVGNHANSDTIFKIDKGIMDGIGEGTIISIMEPGNQNPVTRGTIKRSDRFAAYGVAEMPLGKAVLYEAKTDALNYGQLSSSVKLKLDKNNPQALALQKQITDLLKPFRTISISEDADMMINISDTAGGIQIHLVDLGDSTRWQKTIAKGASLQSVEEKELLSAIKNSMRIKYLRNMPDGGELLKNISVEIIPRDKKINGQEIILSNGDLYSLKIKNNSNSKLFYTVIDLMPDNEISILYPSKNKEAANYLVDKNDSVVRQLKVGATSPKGREFLKVIVSKEPMDLRSVLNHTTRRSEMNSFQEALDDIFADDAEKSTRGDINSIKAEEVGIVTVSFLIQPKNNIMNE